MIVKLPPRPESRLGLLIMNEEAKVADLFEDSDDDIPLAAVAKPKKIKNLM